MRGFARAGICEDDDELRGVLRDALERDGFAVRMTASGAEAVRVFVEDALDVLVLELRALVRRVAPAEAEGAAAGLMLDPGAHAIVHDGARVPLTPTEFRLLAALAAEPDQVVRRGALVAAGWPDGAIVNHNTLDAYLARIRRKLREASAPASIETLRGVGYRLR